MTHLFGYIFFLLSTLLVEYQKISQYLTSPEEQEIVCPRCQSTHIVKNGFIHNGKQKYKCKDCSRQFVLNPQNHKVSQETKQLIDSLLVERISLRGIQRVTGVSWSWLQNYVNDKYRSVPRQITVSPKSKGRLTIECDEMWSFVFSKSFEVYIWLAIDCDTREIVGCFLGDRTRKSAKQLWASLPPVYRQCAVAYTDFWQSYEKVIPSKRHRPVGKDSGLTNHIERFNNTCRQRLSRLVRKSLSFSKKLDNHIGAVWFFIHHYNAQLA